ncbi:alpha-glucosidase (family GH31 glycosyl hydrolase) [Ereboglobus sp. PH5-5]|uniref:glycoside hydrolase family 31 protein n=1 Tax=unclassified Ereboglobus TaxID=2626932 RepID=UPI0024062A88|nr:MULTISPECIES: TIM-barrel domain-containing protein [unclassified Ereboglobus]MDF9826972.1 alpha-glucosidase (family GH31 glycosyl hydrolase) [Ereboglobus sp. PH5-10]MDF9831995.1 alpha-glucosidase (family GH31 glycosyl hydrolase) [Ereboglobus sp. PH5-5]
MKKLILSAAFVLLGAASLSLHGNPLTFGNKRVTIISPTLFRLEYANDAKFLNDRTLFAHHRDARCDDFTVTELGGGRYRITTSALRMEFHDDGFPFGLHNFEAWFTHNGADKKFTLRNRKGGNLGGAISTLDRVAGPIPLDEGLLSRNGWYIINDSGKDIIKDDWIARRDADHVQDVYCFLYGGDYRAALADLGRISGNVPMTRRHVHGVWYCRWWDYNADEYRQIVDEYRQHGFPLDNLVFDMGWHTQDATAGTGHASNRGWVGYTWNRKLIPDPAALVGDLLKDNIYISLNDHPHDGIRPHEAMYKAFMADMGLPADGSTVMFDAGNRRYMETFLRHAHGESWDMGVAFWWLDWQQDYLYPTVRGTSTTHLAWLNELYYKESQRNGLRGANYSRWAGWGDQRHPIQFSGDAHANWKVLAFEVELTATSGNAGCYYWAHDIGGFYGGKDPELYARWTQFGAMSAAMRIHSQYDAKLDRRPWLWGKQAEASMKKAYVLRSELMPYIYSSVWQTHRTMVPLNRAMYIDHGGSPESYKNPQQFMFGDLLLAAPITSAGEGENKIAKQKVWFPAGDAWYDFFTGERHEGGQTKTVAKDIDQFPLYVKGGWLLPLQPYRERPASAPLDTLVMRVYPGADGADNTFTLYEDDGLTRQYEDGRFATTALRYQRAGDKVTLTVTPNGGTFDGKVANRAHRVETSAASIKNIKANGRPVKAIRRGGLQVIEIPAQPVDEPLVIEMQIGK